MLIVVADDLPKTALELLRAEGWTVDARTGRTPDQLIADLQEADALVVRSATKVTADVINRAPKLRAIARAGTGVDNVHVETASTRGIVVMNAPGANSISVAELAMAQLLSLARKLPAADASMKQGKWEKKKFLGEEVRAPVVVAREEAGDVRRQVAQGTYEVDHRGVETDLFLRLTQRGGHKVVVTLLPATPREGNLALMGAHVARPLGEDHVHGVLADEQRNQDGRSP